MSEAPNVYACIAAVSAEIAKEGIAKNRSNAQQGYKFRGIDDVYNALAPVLSKHQLVILPRMLAREQTERQSRLGGTLFAVVVEAEFDFVSARDGSKHTTRAYGEAMDSADKATNKAMSAAYKYTAFQTFCIPTDGDNDADAETHELVNELPDEPPHPAAEPQTRAAQVAEGGPYIYVTEVKIAKRGSNSKGPWTLYAVRFSNGTEGTTFDERLYNTALVAKEQGVAVDPQISGKNLIKLKGAA